MDFFHVFHIFHYQTQYFICFIWSPSFCLASLPPLLKSQFSSDSHWISHIPSSKAPLQQVLDKQQCTTSVVTDACISNFFFIFLKPSLKPSRLDWLQCLCKILYLTSQQSDTRLGRQTRRNLLFLLFPHFFSYLREIWFFVSATRYEVQSQSGLCISSWRLMRTRATG